MPFFSIITASLNNADTIEATLASISSQSFRDFEHIVIDGRSTDETSAILARYSERYPLRWLSESDSGISDALNKGVHKASGRYLLVLQADDQLLYNGVLGRVHELLRNEDYDIFSFPVYVLLGDGRRRLHSPSWFPLIRYHFKNVFRHQGTFIHARVHKRIGLYRPEFAISMDYDLFYRALHAGCSYSVGNDPVSIMGGAGISRRSKYRRIREEGLVQKRNETDMFWRVSQTCFRSLYTPYRLLLHYIVSLRSF